MFWVQGLGSGGRKRRRRFRVWGLEDGGGRRRTEEEEYVRTYVSCTQSLLLRTYVAISVRTYIGKYVGKVRYVGTYVRR